MINTALMNEGLSLFYDYHVLLSRKFVTQPPAESLTHGIVTVYEIELVLTHGIVTAYEIELVLYP